jgi:hypothetical protein
MLDSKLNPPDYQDYEDCHYCGKDLLITNHMICVECAEMRILDLARENKSLLAEIVVGEYVANMNDYLDKILYAWESNDADHAFDAILDAFSGAILKAMEGKL